MHFWEIALRTPQELLASDSEWLRALAVVRAENAEHDEFLAIFRETLERITSAAPTDPVRWCEIFRFVVSWGLRRRPNSERDELLQTALTSQTDEKLRREVEQMGTRPFVSWEDEILAREQQLRQEQQQLREQFQRDVEKAREDAERLGQIQTLRSTLQRQLTRKFTTLPQELIDRIRALDDVARLQAALDQVVVIAVLEDLQL